MAAVECRNLGHVIPMSPGVGEKDSDAEQVCFEDLFLDVGVQVHIFVCAQFSEVKYCNPEWE